MMKHRIDYQFSFPHCYVMLFVDGRGRVVIFVRDANDIGMIEYADIGFVLTDDSAATLATTYSLIFEKIGEQP